MPSRSIEFKYSSPIGSNIISFKYFAKEVLNIVVATEQIDIVFSSISLAGKLDTPGMGFMYVTPLEKASTYIPPKVVEQLEKKE